MDNKDKKIKPKIYLRNINWSFKIKRIFKSKLNPLSIISLKNLKGDINNSKNNNPIISGWLAKIGDHNPRTAIIKLNKKKNFEVVCNKYRSDLQESSINDGNHAFEFIVPFDCIEGKKTLVQLYDKKSNKLISQKEILLSTTQNFTDFSGFLSNSIVSPLIYYPFREEEKRCFSLMENIAKYLIGQSKSLKKYEMFSVIMPVHNRVETVRSAIDSVLNQTYPYFELIIIDDGSDDGTWELLKDVNDKRVRLLRNENCQGVSKARNKALDLARGKYIAYLDSDNTWDQYYLEANIGAFLNLSDADAIYSGQLLFRGNEDIPFAIRFGSFNKSLLINRNYIDINSVCQTYDSYKKFGGFDEDLRRFVDWDLIIRISEKGKIYSIPIILSNYHYDNAGNTITNDKNLIHHQNILREKLKERNKIYEKNFLNSKKEYKNTISIIIPSFQSLEDIKECLESILMLNLSYLVEIIVVDNASNDSVIKYLSFMESEGKIKLIQNKINYGFTYAVNQGIAVSKPENDIIILNNDAILTQNAIEALQNAAYNIPKCGIAVPQQILPEKTETINTHVPYANPSYECDVNLSAHHKNIINVPIFHSGDLVELNFAPFFCAYIKHDTMTRSLGLDPEYGRHYRSDRIFCDYVRHLMNLKIYYVAEAKVYHKLQKSTNYLRKDIEKAPDFDIMLKKNQWDEELAKKLEYRVAKWDL